MTLFVAAFIQLFLCFAPMAFFLRLLQSPLYAATATVCLGILVTFFKLQGTPEPVPILTAAGIMGVRGVSMSLSVWFYWEGGILLALWWTLLLELRHLVVLY